MPAMPPAHPVKRGSASAIKVAADIKPAVEVGDDEDPTKLDQSAQVRARALALEGLTGPIEPPPKVVSEGDDEDPTQLDSRAKEIAKHFGKEEPAAPRGPEEDEDPTKLDPKAQALALEALRKMNAVAPGNGKVVPTPRRGRRIDKDQTKPNQEASTDPPPGPDDVDDDAETGLGFDKQDLFGGLPTQNSSKGGTAIMGIAGQRQQWSALPDDVRVFIQDDALESLPARPVPKSRVVLAAILSIAAGLAIAFLYLFFVRR
jgi:hypothetical protein